MDLKWTEMSSKVNFGHPKWPINLKWPELRSKVNFGNPKWPIDLKWPEMRSKVNFGHPKMAAGGHFVKNFKKKKVAYQSEMDRNEIESDFQTSKMATGSQKNKKK